MKKPMGFVALHFVPVALALAGTHLPTGTDDRGKGWSLTHLDFDVHVLPDEQRLELEGTARVRLDGFASSTGPNLFISMGATDGGDPLMQFTDVECPGADVSMRRGRNGWMVHIAELRFDHAKQRGDELTVTFSAESQGRGSQLVVADDVAVASWTKGWHPYTNPSTEAGITHHAGTLGAPGQTRVHLPQGWISVLDGTRVERLPSAGSADRSVEVWETAGLARSLVAGPYTEVVERVGEREVRVYMQSNDKVIRPRRLAQLVGDAMAAQEKHLGPFPFDSYAVVEVPSNVPAQDWSAASQQTFIMAKSGLFDHEHGNLALWAHEMSHGWWGNTVGHTGPGVLWCGEALAQFGALTAIGALQGPEALHEFLAFSREGFSPLASAAGYFTMVRQGLDLEIATMGSDGIADVISDSKGAWVYHMLRHELGDAIFFGVLRGVIGDFAGKEVTTAEIRRRFVAAAPDHDLERFFAQWLDRTGAPVLDVDWHATAQGDGAVIELSQTQEGEPFAFDLDLQLEVSTGETLLRTVTIDQAQARFRIETPSRPLHVEVDPDYKVLIWRPEYGPLAGDDMGQLGVPDDVLAAVVGTYRIERKASNYEILRKDDQLFIQGQGTPPLRLLHRTGGVFQIDVPGEPLVLEFDLSRSPAPSFRSVDSDDEYVADRVSG